MIILNINGPINSGKSTVSRLLVDMLPRARFVEVDDLMSDAEEQQLGLSMADGWGERLNRLDKIVATEKKANKYQTIIFAYPMTDGLYRRWHAYNDATTQFVAVTLSPSLENCLTNRGTRELTQWEIGRIRQMYNEGYNRPANADLIINNDGQTPAQTAKIVADFVRKKHLCQK